MRWGAIAVHNVQGGQPIAVLIIAIEPVAAGGDPQRDLCRVHCLPDYFEAVRLRLAVG